MKRVFGSCRFQRLNCLTGKTSLPNATVRRASGTTVLNVPRLDIDVYKRQSECMIDSIAQSWSVLSGYGNPERSKTALLSAERFLVDAENGVIKLLTPPFTEASIADVGYIASYPPGIRENGAQYTHCLLYTSRFCFSL